MPKEGMPTAPGHSRQVLDAHVMADGSLVVRLDPMWSDPAAWGLLLVDVARHAARAYAQNGTCPEASALTRIRQGFDAEWDHPTDDPQGSLVV